MQDFRPEFIVIPTVLFDYDLDAKSREIYGYIYWLYKLKDGKCSASNEYLARIARTTAQTVQNCLTKLENAGVIKRTYANTDKKVRKEIIPLIIWGVSPVGDTVSPARDTQVSPAGYQNKNNINILRKADIYTSSADEASTIKEIISLFSAINPSYKLLFKRNNQRQAAARLLAELGKERLLRVVAYAISVQGEQYAPTITTPIQLEEKLGRLKIYYEKNNKKKGVQKWQA